MSQLTEDLQQNYRVFVTGIRATGIVWGVKASGGWVVCESDEFEETDVVPFWSDEQDARSQCSGEWTEHQPESIDLNLFIKEWLSGMAEDGTLIGPNWNAELAGLEVEPSALAQQLLDEAKNDA